MIRFLVVDDHAIIRKGMTELINLHWPMAQTMEAATLAEAQELLLRENFKVVLLDLSLPDCLGLEALVSIRRQAPGVPILVVSFHSESVYAKQAMLSGADGYVGKTEPSATLLIAIQTLLDGRKYISPNTAETLLKMLETGLTDRAPHELLSAQESRILAHIASGERPSATAMAMGISVKTYSTYRARVKQKLGVSSTTAIVKYCIDHNLLGN